MLTENKREVIRNRGRTKMSTQLSRHLATMALFISCFQRKTKRKKAKALSFDMNVISRE